MFWTALAMNVGSSLLQYGAESAQAKAQRMWQAYSNKMTRLSDANNQNAITQNEVMTMRSYVDQAIDIKQDALSTAGSITVSAAAAGVKGRSVNQTLFDAARSASVAEGRRQMALQDAFLSFDQQRRQSAFSSALNQDHSYIPKPSLASSLLKGTMNSMSYWKQGAGVGGQTW